MGVKGGHIKKFEDVNLATAVGVHLNGDYHFFFDIVETEDKNVVLKSHKDGTTLNATIKRRNGQEYITYIHKGILQKMGYPAETVKVMPFKGERF